MRIAVLLLVAITVLPVAAAPAATVEGPGGAVRIGAAGPRAVVSDGVRHVAWGDARSAELCPG